MVIGYSSSSDASLTINTILHMPTIKLSSNNYLLWKNLIAPFLRYQNLISHVDETSVAPTASIVVEDKSSPNPLYTAWVEPDQRALLIIQDSLNEESMAEILGLLTAREVWTTLESAYSHDSIERKQNLRDSFRQLQKGSLSVF